MSPYKIVPLRLLKTGIKYKFAFGPEYIPGDPVYHAVNCDYAGFSSVLTDWAGLTKDASFIDLSYNQLQWITGQNPLGICMISGLGANSPRVFAEYHGKGAAIKGGIPNGIMFDVNGSPVFMGNEYLSGEYWLPHNAYWMTALSKIVLKGTVSISVNNDNSKNEKVSIQIFDNKKNQKAFIQTDKKNPAAFNLKAKQYYSIVVTSEHEKMEKTVYLAPGANVDVDFDFDRQISLNINKPYNIKKGTPARFEALLTNNGKKPVQAQIKLILRGGKCHNLNEYRTGIEDLRF